MKNIKLYSYFVLGIMIAVTTWASLDKNVIEGFNLLFQEPWGVATLLDAYFAFLFFSAWVLFKEVSNVKRTFWILFILSFGNMAMALYVLKEIKRLAPTDMNRYLTEKNTI